MKKVAIVLAIVLAVAVALAAYAAATKYTLGLGPAAAGTETGWVIVNNNPQKTVVNFQVDGLTVGNGEKYFAYYLDGPNPPAMVLGELKVNKKGSGHLNAHVPGGIPSESYLGVADRDVPPPTSGQVVLFIQLP